MHGHDLALKSGTNIPADNNPAELHENVQGRDERESDGTQKNEAANCDRGQRRIHHCAEDCHRGLP